MLGLALGGAGGPRVLEILEQEISSTMANLGCSSIADLTADTVRWSISAGPD